MILLAFSFPDRWAKLRLKKISRDGIDTYPPVDSLDAADEDSDEELESDDVSKESTGADRGNPLSRMFSAALKKDFPSHTEAFNDALSGESEDKEYVNTLYHEQRIRMGAQSSVEDLRRLHEQHPNWIRPGVALSRYLIDTGQIAKATQLLNDCIERSAANPLPEAHEAMADVISTTESLSKALEWCQKQVKRTTVPSIRSVLLFKAAKFSKSLDLKADAILLADRSIRENPDNHRHRFQAAFFINEVSSKHPLAFFHYSVLRRLVPDTAHTLNNFAAYFVGSSKLPYAELMRAAGEHTPSWSLANLAIYCADHGLFSSAEDFLAQARTADPTDKRVVDAANTIKKRREESDKTLKQELEKAATYDRFYSVCEPTAIDMPKSGRAKQLIGIWTNDENEVSIGFLQSDQTDEIVCSFFRARKLYKGTLNTTERIFKITAKEVRTDERPTVLSFIPTLKEVKIEIAQLSKNQISALCEFDGEETISIYHVTRKQLQNPQEVSAQAEG